MKITLDVKSFQETLHSNVCGPASLKIVLDYYGLSKSEKELAELTGMTLGLGADDKGIVYAAETFGFKTLIKNESDFSDIENWLAKGVPAILNWFTRGREDYPPSEMVDGHYSVVIRLDDNFIYLQDPEIGGVRKIKREDFLRVWFDFRREYIKADELILRQLIAVYR